MLNLDKKSYGILILGILILIATTWYISVSIENLSLTTLFIIIFTIYVLTTVVLNKRYLKTLILFTGLIMLACTLIWYTSKTGFLDIPYLIISLIFIIGGILGILGYGIEKWFSTIKKG